MPHSSVYIVLTVIFQQEENKWTAECVELGTATFGDSLEDIVESIDEAIQLHLNTLEDVGECERFLREQNIKIHRIAPKPKTKINIKDIPLGSFVHPEVREIACV